MKKKKPLFNKIAAVSGWEVTVGIILFLALFFVIFPFLNVIKADTSSRIDDFKCAQSVEIALRSHKFLGDTLDCPTKYISMAGKDDLSSKKIIADSLDWCWYNFKQGEKELFAHSDNNYCVVCSVFEFDEQSKPIYGFSDYLAQNPVAKSLLQNNNKTHIEFLQKTTMEDSELRKFSNMAFDGVIDPKQTGKYAAVFVYGKDASVFANHYLLDLARQSNYLKFFYSGTAMIAGRSIGSDWDARVALIPYEEKELSSVCNVLQ